MREIKLGAKSAEQEAIKAYLEENASEVLAEKINNGVYIEKDGKRLLNKKDLDGFMSFASDEARKQAEKGARFACIKSDTVFGWAIHYFEEDDIIGKLYNEDGTEYKPVVKKSSPKPTTPPPAPAKKKEGGQLSLFDTLTEPEATIPTTTAENEPEEEDDPHRLVPMPGTEGDWGRRHWGSDLEEDEDEDEAADVVEEDNSEDYDGDLDEEEPRPIPPIITRYRGYADEEPEAIVVMHVGDFYEVLGKNAARVGEAVDLVVVQRDGGPLGKIPMIGFPFHRKDIYLEKICALAPVYLIESEDEKVLLRQEREEPTMVINTATGEVFDEPQKGGEFDEVLTHFFGKDWVMV